MAPLCSDNIFKIVDMVAGGVSPYVALAKERGGLVFVELRVVDEGGRVTSLADWSCLNVLDTQGYRFVTFGVIVVVEHEDTEEALG
mmetsp:Transcript_18956/g.21728  ORF Transcript_18956/g.21728 Transcript_18956/m.21728 type:complete len:86 (-) Transcript_18956:277-534(-)